MLKLVLGRKQTGKTQYCFDRIRELALQNKSVMLLVPEQFSFECQKLLLKELGLNTFNKIEIHSFTSLCEAIGSKFGGISGVAVDEGIRLLLIKQALLNTRDNLKVYSRYVESSEFASKILSLMTELKQADIDSEALLQLSEKCDNNSFRDKLKDISLILSAYNACIENKFIEPLDTIEKTLLNMKDNSYFNNKYVFIDEFKGFTESQFNMLDMIISGSKEVYATFCCDSLYPSSETDIFTNVKKSANRLSDIAKRHAIEVESLSFSYNNINLSDDILALESIVCEASASVYDGKGDAVAVVKCSGADSEIDFVLTEIRRLIRTEDYRYKDFVIISRNDSIYRSFIDNMSLDYNIPCHTDSKVSVATLPLSVFAVAAVSAAASFDSEDIFKLLKTGLFNVDDKDISFLENYVYLWSITGKKWLNEWNMSPFGLNECEQKDIDFYEELRKRVVVPIVALRKSSNGTVTDICRALMRFFDDVEAVDLLKNYTAKLEADNKFKEAEYQRLGYDSFVKAIDKICLVFGSEVKSLGEFSNILSDALSVESVGEFPQTKDNVIYGTADRIRPMRPKVAFIIGANQDVFPASVDNTSLFTKYERKAFIDNGFNISDCSLSDTFDERFLFYNFVCCASDKVYITYSAGGFDGSVLEPSYMVNTIKELMPNINFVDCSIGSEIDINRLEASEPSFRKLTLNYNSKSVITSSLRKYFSDKTDYSRRLKTIQNSASRVNQSLSQEVTKKLYGDNIRLSASKIDVFNSCRFMYFCRYGLGIEKLNKVDFDPLTRGNIIHYVLEQFVSNHLDDIGTLENSLIKQEVTSLCDRYIESLMVDKTALDDKFNYMLSILKETAVIIAEALRNEFAQSDFRPKFCELKVGKRADGEVGIDGASVTLSSGETVTINGSIDRVDTTTDGKLRVVDYKTGTKDFRLSSVLYGMNMQMLLYLYTAIMNGYELLKADHPAGILYFPARRIISDGEQNGFVKMNGLIEKDSVTIHQMERDGKGKIVPVTFYPNQVSMYKTNSVVETEGFDVIFKYLELSLKKIGEAIMKGNIDADPLKVDDKLKCEYCDYRTVCRVCTKDEVRDSEELSTADTVEIMRQEVEKYGC